MDNRIVEPLVGVARDVEEAGAYGKMEEEAVGSRPDRWETDGCSLLCLKSS